MADWRHQWRQTEQCVPRRAQCVYAPGEPDRAGRPGPAAPPQDGATRA